MLTFLMILLTVVVDLGWMFFQLVSLRAAAGEGATVATICPTDLTTIRNRVRFSSSDPGDLDALTDDQIQICFVDPITGDCGGPIEIETEVRITVTYNQHILNPLIGTMIGSQTYPITVTATGAVISTICPASMVSSP